MNHTEGRVQQMSRASKGQYEILAMIGSLIIVAIIVMIIVKQIFPARAAYVFYSAKADAEALSGIISSFSSFSGNATIIYILPKGSCDIYVSEDDVTVELYSAEIPVGGGGDRKIKINEQSATREFIKVNNIDVIPFEANCSTDEEKQVMIGKFGDEIK